MESTDDRMKILNMLREGKLSPESAAQLLQAVDAGSANPVPDQPKAQLTQVKNDGLTGERARWLRVRVTDTDTGRPRVNVRLPISLVNLGLKLGSHYSPEIQGMDLDALIEAAQSGGTGPFVDVYDEDDGEHVEVFLE